MIKVIDNLLTPRYADQLLYDAQHVIQYCYKKQTSEQIDYGGEIFKDERTYDGGQFSCPIVVCPHENVQFAWYFNLLKAAIYSIEDAVPELEIEGVNRIKFNLLLKNSEFPEDHYNLAHQDATRECYSLVYYLNDSDGDTYLFNEFYEDGKIPDKLTVAQRVTPKKNRAVIFDSTRYHASANPRNSSERFVINYVFKARLK